MNVYKKALKNAALWLITPTLGFLGTACDSADTLDISVNTHNVNQYTKLDHKYYRDGAPATETVHIYDIEDNYCDNSNFYVTGELNANCTNNVKWARQQGGAVSPKDIAKDGNVSNISYMSLSDNYNRIIVEQMKDGSFTRTEYGELSSDGIISREGRNVRRNLISHEGNLTAEEAFKGIHFDDYCM